MAMKNNKYLILLSFWYIICYCNFCLYLYHFFPVMNKSNVETISPPEWIQNMKVDPKSSYVPQVDRIIIMVIDALRNDFVTFTNMPYTYSHIKKSKACLLSAKVEAPTVTMPRIKAMTTGSVPQFIDVVLNFASKEIKHDSFLHRAKAKGKIMTFYGDNTWLKLFPNMFHRKEGTTSFYVNDFTEVDNNVTRHIDKELKREDWDILILHYLGLDHIGHVHGPFHPLIPHKLQEMDNIIQTIHTTISLQHPKTVIVICGDHGMKDAGGHGGSSEPETSVPLIFLGLSCPHAGKIQVKQSDLAPTLSVLMGLDLPADNIGSIITDIMDVNLDRKLYMLHYNALNILQKDERHRNVFARTFQRHKNFLLQQLPNEELLVNDYASNIRKISDKLIQESTVQNTIVLWFSFVAAFTFFMSILFLQDFNDYLEILGLTIVIAFVLIYIPFFHVSLVFLILYAYFVGFVFVTKILKIFYMALKFTTSPMLTFLFVGSFVRPLCLISSTYIEEEHLIWFHFWGTITLFGAIQEVKARSYVHALMWIGLFATLRISRHLNHIGIFNSVTYDISDWLMMPDNNIMVTLTFITGLIGLLKSCGSVFNSKMMYVLSCLTLSSIYLYRYSLYYDKHTTYEARIAEICIIVTGIISYIKYREIFKSFSVMWMCWSALLMRPYNVLLIPTFFVTSQTLFKLVSSKKILLFLHYWLGYIFLHCQGIDNTLSSIDISPGYVGLDQYSLFLTSFQVICHSYTFPILSYLLLFSRSTYTEQIKMLHTLMVLRMYNVIVCCFSLLVHRQHLFIWSVFSPKLLIEGCHATIDFLIIISYLMISKCTKNK